MQRIRNRALDGLVVLGEGPVGHRAQRNEDAADAFRIHDERAHVVLRLGVGLEVGNVIAHPLLGGFVPPDLLARRVPRLARSDRRRRGCTARAGSPATTTPSSDRYPAPKDPPCRAAASSVRLRSMSRNTASCRTWWCRRRAAWQSPASCCPAFSETSVFSSVMSASALPLISFAISASEGCAGSV